MGWWYWIGVSCGIGAALGVVVSGLTGLVRTPFAGVVLTVLLIPAVVWPVEGLVSNWDYRWAGLGGFALACVGAAVIVRGALRRGGTRGGTATLVAGAAVVVAGLAFVPVAGYLEALALPALALRLRRKQPERYAGLRTLARD